MARVTIFSRMLGGDSLRSEYFFSTNHCQPRLSKEWVPTSFYLPHYVKERPSLPSGLVETAADVITVYHSEDTEVPNPDPKYQG